MGIDSCILIQFILCDPKLNRQFTKVLSDQQATLFGIKRLSMSA